MYINVISFKNGKTLPFQSETPYSVDKVVDGWNLVTDETNGQIVSFKGSEIVTIASKKVEDPKHIITKPGAKKKAGLKTSITTE